MIKKLNCYEKLNFKFKSNLRTGQIVDKSSQYFYGGVEHHDQLLVNRLKKMAMLMMFTMFVPPLILPILYAIRKYPEPEQWFLPVRAK